MHFMLILQLSFPVSPRPPQPIHCPFNCKFIGICLFICEMSAYRIVYKALFCIVLVLLYDNFSVFHLFYAFVH